MNTEFRNKKVVITGPRKLHPEDQRVVYVKMVEVLKDHPHSVTIGGAMGVDTAAFIACAKAKRGGGGLNDFYLEVVLPGCLGDAPRAFQDALKASALLVDYTPHGHLDRSAPRVLIIELGMDPGHPASYLTRNAVMLGRAGWSADCGVLLGFPGIGETRGGTLQTIAQARAQRMAVVEQPVRVLAR